MLTKTGELLMRKKHESSQNRISLSKAEPEERSVQMPPILQRTARHISHVNEYNFISISNKLAAELPPSQEVLQQLEVQNFRLIEENMRLVEWSRSLLARTRQSIMRVIQGIEEFRYLDSVNKLYQVIGELSEHEENGLQAPRLNAKQHYMNLKRLDNHEGKVLSVKPLEVKKLQSFTYDPKQSQPAQQRTDKNLKEEERTQKIPAAKFLPENMRADYSDFEPTTSEAELLNMLLLQSLGIQSLVNSR